MSIGPMEHSVLLDEYVYLQVTKVTWRGFRGRGWDRVRGTRRDLSPAPVQGWVQDRAPGRGRDQVPEAPAILEKVKVRAMYP